MAQAAMAQLKAAVHMLLRNVPDGLKNVEIGRALGIYMGHEQQHEGHIPRVLLAIMDRKASLNRTAAPKHGACGLVPRRKLTERQTRIGSRPQAQIFRLKRTSG